ncbi:Phosphoglycerate mutase [Kribbella flavida DSM 17836]|uniref:Phosphoglycerate mutase n=1 Tax=Kribbella flavida (strain DSM 17836 / JCM 10339 / NBRC 14399) TaxID=479435 RepID=D2PR61_KRIFD|nr:histidine phosphatase family protein [Kribbella flavida]ADB33009.1 Phosphoglycerate mutase [Kribbella flavida DSM 17836]
MLILVRHAMPAHGPDTPARDWLLAPEGHAAARALGERLPPAARLVASTEPKAIATLAPAGPVIQDPRFDEISRVEAYDDNFRTQRRAYVEGTDHPDWEPRDEVVSRFHSGVLDHLTAAENRPLIIASHGMAITLWLTATVSLRTPGIFWADLRFPDTHAVDLTARTVTRLDPP